MPHGAKADVVEWVASDLKKELEKCPEGAGGAGLLSHPGKECGRQLPPRTHPIDSDAAPGTCFKHVLAMVGDTVADRFNSMRHVNNHAVSPK